MHILVTGGAGYIGSVVAKYMLNEGHDVTVLDNLRTGRRERVPEGARYLMRDYTARWVLEDLPPIDCICHLAAETNVAWSMHKPAPYFDQNVAGTISLLEEAVAHGCFRFIFASSSSVYGATRVMPIGEDTPPAPLSPYAVSKWLVEQMLPWYARAYGLKYVAFRFFNVVGAVGSEHADRDLTHIVPAFLSALRDGKPAVLHHGGDPPEAYPVKDYIDVRDVASAHICALRDWKKAQGKVFNICSGAGYSVLEVYQTCQMVVGRYQDFVEAPPRPGDTPLMVGSRSLAYEVLGWEPQYELLSSISAQWEAMHER